MRFRLLPPLLSSAALAIAAQSLGQAAPDALKTEGYLLPPRAVADAALAPWYKNISLGQLNSSGQFSLITERDGAPPLARLARPYEKLGGLQVDRQAIRERSLYVRSAVGFRIMNTATGALKPVNIPDGARVSNPVWAPNGAQFAFLAHFEDRSELWVGDLEGRTRRATDRPLLPVAVTTPEWTRNGDLVAIFRPDGLTALPPRVSLPSSPRILSSTPAKEKLYVFASLLQTPEDTQIYRAAVTGQLAIVTPGGKFRTVGKPAAYRGIDASPTGEQIIATYLDGPVSYVLPEGSFGERDAIIDANGKELVELDKRPMQTEDEPPKPKDDARRAIRWRPDGAGLSFLQLGPVDKDKKRKDRLVLWKAPFTDKDAVTVLEQDNRISSVNYTADAKQFSVTDSQDGKTRIRLFAMGKPESRTIAEYKADEAETTGTLISSPDGYLRINSDRYVYFAGSNKRQDVLKDPVKPWIDQVDLTDGKRSRVFEGAADASESATMTTNDMVVVSRQSRTEVPDLYAQNLVSKSRLKLTQNTNFVPDLTRAKIEYIPVTRSDGMKLWVKVTSPAEGVFRRKAFFWFYPAEFKDQKAYDDSRKNLNPNLFTPVSGGSKTILLRAGYVLVEPDCPIFANYGASNDSYVPQLRNNLSAVIDELAKRDIIDREKLAIGGHSYGAFSTMNALINTPFFKAGIAGDGNYNRTLTPYGFQNESRPLWLGREVYLSMSPILYADQITAAVLMYHGGDDQNVGTALINSERMFNALESLGKTAALYVYPYEDHGQIAKETMLDQWARWVAWLDKYVK